MHTADNERSMSSSIISIEADITLIDVSLKFLYKGIPHVMIISHLYSSQILNF